MSRAVDPRRDTLPPLRPLPRRVVRQRAWQRLGLWVFRITVIVGWALLVWAITGSWIRR